MRSPDIHDITDPGEFLPEPTPFWQSGWFIALVITGLILIALILFLIFRKKTTVATHKTLLDKARERLEKLKSDDQPRQAQAIATRISLIIRQYLEAAFEDPALFETNEEFTLRPHALAMLHPDSRQPVTELLITLSQLKYTPHVSADRIDELIKQAGDVLSHIELHIPARDATSLSS